MYAVPLTEQQQNLSESGTKLYSDLEVETLIDEVSQAAFEAIEKAAGEAAQAAMLASLEREAAAYREADRWRVQADINATEIKQAKKDNVKNIIIAGFICFFGGLAVGVGGTFLIRN
jgi:hypothetical protein